MDANRPADEADDSFEPIDPDFALLVDFVTGALSPEQEAVVEERLVEDEAFFNMCVPLVQMHHVFRTMKWDSGFVPPPLPNKSNERQ